MRIYPAIDIKDGKCVRLFKGQFSDVTVYGDSPAEMAKKWESLGGEYIHVVDLDGALKGHGVNAAKIKEICESVNVPSEFVKRAVDKYGKKIVIGIDAKDGMVAIEGWEKTSDFTAVEFAKKMVNIGVQTIVYTDIATDGTLAGPNVNAMAEMASAVNADIIASGGVGSLDHIKSLVTTGVEGVIVGKALYTDKVDLTEAIKAVK